MSTVSEIRNAIFVINVSSPDTTDLIMALVSLPPDKLAGLTNLQQDDKKLQKLPTFGLL